ncbi:MAG: dihydroorotate dehydrogenase [Leptolyngbya sp. PLA2]|nr:dihydroorotate dehydrogenase [Leptolyngbya sp.]MCE7972561.1 dihydroorotate dehydrogenase [Leptolyngbya sp. PL-A2]MCZ7632531.1 dihydroorotate dehydrogenase [Phycisphaerales bacterium]MDL1905011.1 dihydroorotate dehydrogenase [Synechococcales cyanobacterium CNB]GIK19911.1 MAG: dihydroorotate dehydrogenase B (NAD(+)), catalytic subunit [Planctomycetota bacterium]
MNHRDSTLVTDLAGLRLRNPVMLAAGTAGTLDEMADVLDLGQLGAVVTKSITPQPREGNATWRILESKAGMLNSIGLANVGLDAFEAHVAPRIPSVPTAIVGSVAGFSVDDYVLVAGAMGEIEAIAAVELNVSCPNVRHGTEFGADPRLLRELVGAVRAALPRTRMFVKLSPVAIGTPHGIADLARAAIEAGAVPSGPNSRPGADALTIANTVPAMAIDPATRRPRLANVTGGLSGPAVHPIAVKLVYDAHRLVCRDTGTPIIGCGGVQTWDDAAELILAGASAVQMGTALFADPRSPVRVVRGLERWVGRHGTAGIGELVGGVLVE